MSSNACKRISDSQKKWCASTSRNLKRKAVKTTWPRLTTMVRACSWKVYKPHPITSTPHTYLDGIGPFTYLGQWAVGILHSTATLSIQSVPVACMGFGSCTVSIFPCPASATLAGWALFFPTLQCPNPNPMFTRLSSQFFISLVFLN